MNRQEITIVVLLAAALIAWTVFQQRQAASAKQQLPPRTLKAGAARETHAAARASTNAAPEAVLDVAAEAPAPPPHLRLRQPEQLAALTNREAKITLSSWGGGITAVQFNEYRATVAKDSGPVKLDFNQRPALALYGAPGFTTNDDFSIQVVSNGTAAVVSATNAAGVALTRTLALVPGCRLHVSDAFANGGAQPFELPEMSLGSGPMRNLPSETEMSGYANLGVDTLADQGGSDVLYWGKKALPGLFGVRQSFMSCARQSPVGLPDAVARKTDYPVSWAAAKNKFFVQILAPETEGVRCEVGATRDPAASNHFAIGSVHADLVYAGATLKPGETQTRHVACYIGPKKYALLKSLPDRQSDVMQFGWWSWFRGLCTLLLITLNGIYAVIPNYGVAVIVLTVLVRFIFWPVTHKSNESMKKMQQLQPLIAALRTKHKDNPQKLQQETMALYKVHKVNPLAGCLPMVVQIPVFIALFTVLRSAIELRLADFLWVKDLSGPEAIPLGRLLLMHAPFAGWLAFPINFLPLVMTATMVWQQHLTPTAGDPQQRRMMMLMPAFMLFLFYNMAAGLVLYWSVSQILSIVQLLLQKRRSEAAAAAKA